VGRRLLALTTTAALALLGAAQGPPRGRPAVEQLALFRTHRPLLAELLDHALKLSEAGDSLDRADRARAAAVSLVAALDAAAAEPDADPSRVAELATHLAGLVRDGLCPALEQAAFDHRPGSDGHKRLVEVRRRSGEELIRAGAVFRGEGPAGRSAQVRTARGEVEAAVRGLPVGD
jgi:hypothetical protein